MKKILVIVLYLLIVFSIAACGGAKKEAADSGISNDAVHSYPGSAPSEGAYRDQAAAEEGKNMIGDLDNRKIIQNAELNIDVENMEKIVKDIERQVAVVGGFLEESNTGRYNTDSTWANMVLRVPSSEFQEFLSFLEEKGDVKNRRVYMDDVTTHFIDLEARLRVLKAEEESILSILNNASKVEDVLNIRKELRSIRSEIEVLEGELKYLSNMVAFSTIRIHLQQVKVSETRIDPAGFSGVWQKGLSVFTKNVNSMISLTGNIVVFIIGSIPFLIPLGIAGFGLWHLKKRKKKDQTSI